MRCHLLGMAKLKADGHFSRMPLFLHFCVNVATCGKRFGSVGSVGAEIQSPDLAIHPLSASSLPFDQLWAHQSSITWFLCCHVAVYVRTDTGSFYKIFRARRIWKVPEGCHAMWCCSFVEIQGGDRRWRFCRPALAKFAPLKRWIWSFSTCSRSRWTSFLTNFRRWTRAWICNLAQELIHTFQNFEELKSVFSLSILHHLLCLLCISSASAHM